MLLLFHRKTALGTIDKFKLRTEMSGWSPNSLATLFFSYPAHSDFRALPQTYLNLALKNKPLFTEVLTF